MQPWGRQREVEKVKDLNTIEGSIEAASRDYPSVEFIPGHRMHVFFMNGDWVVWLNTEFGDFDGLCLSVGKDKQEALTEAIKVLEAAHDFLQSGRA